MTPKEFYEKIRNTIRNEQGAKSADEYLRLFDGSEDAIALRKTYKPDDVNVLIIKAVRNAKDRADWSGKVRDYTCHIYATETILPISEDMKKRMTKDIMTNDARAVRLDTDLGMHHPDEYRELLRLSRNDDQSVHAILVGVINRVYGYGDRQWFGKSGE